MKQLVCGNLLIETPELTEEQLSNGNYYDWNEKTQQWDLNE